MTCLTNCTNCGKHTLDRQLCKVCGDPKFKALQTEVRHLREALGIIQQNIKAGAVTYYWIEKYIKDTLSLGGDKDGEHGGSQPPLKDEDYG